MHKQALLIILLIISVHFISADIERVYEPVVPDISYFSFREDIQSVSYLYIEAGALTNGAADFIVSALNSGNYTRVYLNTENLDNCRCEASYNSYSPQKGRFHYDFSFHTRLAEGEDRIFYADARINAFCSAGRDTLFAVITPYLLLPDFYFAPDIEVFMKHPVRTSQLGAGTSYLNVSDPVHSNIFLSLSSNGNECGLFFYNLLFPKLKAEFSFPSKGRVSLSVDFERKNEGSSFSLFNPISYYADSYRERSFLSADANAVFGSFSASIKAMSQIDSVSGYGSMDLSLYDLSAAYSAVFGKAYASFSVHSLSGSYFQADYADIEARLPFNPAVSLLVNYSPCYYRGEFSSPLNIFLLFGDSSVQAAAGVINMLSENDPLQPLYSSKRSFTLRLILKDASIFNHY